MTLNLNNIRVLRERTGLGLSTCSQMLKECGGNLEEAYNKLRIIGLTKANKISNRITSDGLIAIHINEGYGVLVELNCETDFVARNEKFIDLIANIASIACHTKCTSLDELNTMRYDSINMVQEAVMNMALVLGEKLELSKLQYLSIHNTGIISGYVHGDTYNLGKTGSLVALQTTSQQLDKLKQIGKEIAMHIVAMKPEVLCINDIDLITLEKERSIITSQVKHLNKPKDVIKKIVNGRIAKYFEEVVLLEQKFIKDENVKIADLIANSELGPIILHDYKLMILGL
ncbi:translation elongation factor Ts [Wolbachia endosymbiont of Howardula sp.]|uniref:translation elongation factor Ts n=1 Tax=Wolbachia endosymbiont of Howardula sp. TaxID=2916816 RepID=UPI00217EFF5D|nr:translation elongation factor Ts [Wolbachia endosymbiont of Howardula sp.]UWI83081.1 translation elongation factor Ts [Wolbachia endosymbiont of Howardula sp.]